MKTKIYNLPNYFENDPHGKKRGVKTRRERTRKTGRWLVPSNKAREPMVFTGVLGEKIIISRTSTRTVNYE